MAIRYEEQSLVMRTGGDEIRARRNRIGFTITELAEDADVSPDTLSDWEAGRRNPQTATVDKVVEALERREHEMSLGPWRPPEPAGGPRVVRFIVKNVYGAEALVVEVPPENMTELEVAVDRIMRNLRGGESP